MMGRLTRNPEVRQTKGDEPKTVAKFGIAVERDYTVQGEKLTDFFEVETWQKTAEFVEKYLKKGQLIALDGKLVRPYHSAGLPASQRRCRRLQSIRFSYYIEAKNVYFAEGRKSEPENTAAEEAPKDDSPAPSGFDPFDDEDDFDPFAEE